MATNAWFNETYYLQSKLAQLRADDPQNPAAANLVALQSALQAAGFTPLSHFEAFGAIELTSPNPYFNATEYLEAKTRQLNESEDEPRDDWTADEVALAIYNAGLTPWTHFQQHGWKEGVNPSNDFDVSSYLESKLAQLQRDDPEGNWTEESMIAAFEQAQLDPITHYYEHGETEGVEVAEVPADEQVPTDERDLGGTFTLTTQAGEQVIGTAQDDTFRAVLDSDTAANGTLNVGDLIDGKGGFDTLDLVITGANATLPGGTSISNIEKVNLLLGADNPTINATAFGSSVEELWLRGQVNATVNNLGANTTLGLAAAGAPAATPGTVGITATGNAVNLQLEGVDTSRTINMTGTGSTLQTVNLNGNTVSTADGGVVDIVLNDTSGKASIQTLNVALSSETDIEAQGLTALKTVDASQSTGDLQFDLAGLASGLTITGGSGDDYFIMSDKFSALDTVDGGEGEDTVQITLTGGTLSAGQANAINAFQNIEALYIDNAVTDLDASRITSVDTLAFGDAATVTGISDAQSIVGAAGAVAQTLTLSHQDSTAGAAAGTVNVTSLSLLTVESGATGFANLVVDGQGTITFDNSTVAAATNAATSVDLSGLALDANDDGEIDLLPTSTITLRDDVAEDLTLSGGIDVVTVASSTYANLDTITGFTQGGDYQDILVTGIAPTATQVDVSSVSSLAAAFQLAANDAGALQFFHFEGNTYLFGDTVGDGTVDDSDFALELIGTFDFSEADSGLGAAI